MVINFKTCGMNRFRSWYLGFVIGMITEYLIRVKFDIIPFTILILLCVMSLIIILKRV